MLLRAATAAAVVVVSGASGVAVVVLCQPSRCLWIAALTTAMVNADVGAIPSTAGCCGSWFRWSSHHHLRRRYSQQQQRRNLLKLPGGGDADQASRWTLHLVSGWLNHPKQQDHHQLQHQPWLVEGATSANEGPNDARRQRSLHRGTMEGMITTPKCSNLRSSDSFLARLDLLYLYQIEYVTTNITNNNDKSMTINNTSSRGSSIPGNTTTTNNNNNSTSTSSGSTSTPNEEQDEMVVAPLLDLFAIDRAVVMALVDTLTQCDAKHRPGYAIQTSDPPQQEFTNGE